MRPLTLSSGCLWLTLAWPELAAADVLLFRLDEGDRLEWEAVLAERDLELSAEFDFCELSDWGIRGALPATSCDGNEVIPENFIPCSITIDSNIIPHGVGGRNSNQGNNDLDAVGPAAGFGNECNALVSSYFAHGVDIYDSGSNKPFVAMVFRPVLILTEDGFTDITVYNENEEQIAQFIGVPAFGSGTTTIGLLATDGDTIARVNIWDHYSDSSGIQGAFRAYSQRVLPAEVVDFEVVVGAHALGGVDDLEASDDSYLVVRSGVVGRLSQMHQARILLSAATKVGSPEVLSVAIESRISNRAGIATLSVRNWVTGELDRIGQYAIGMEELRHEFPGISALDHVRDDGAIELSIKHVVVAPFLAFRFDSSLDVVEIAVE